MSQVIEHFFASTQAVLPGAERDVSRFTPGQIREAIADLVAQDLISTARPLGDAGLSLYPQSEDMLSINALLSCTGGDWTSAETLLRELLALQGDQAPVMPWLMLVRSLRCQIEPVKAADALATALALHPKDSGLLQEQVLVQALMAQGAAHSSVPQIQ